MEFIDPFDQALAETGIPGIFTFNHEMVLQFDLIRTRDFRRQNPGPYQRTWVHCVLVDRETSWPQYVLATAPELVRIHERAEIFIYETSAEALLAVERKKKRLYQKTIHHLLGSQN